MDQSKLGPRVKMFRERAGLSRAELAEKAGLAETFVTALEERDIYPSLTPLLKLARALGVRMGTFLDDVQTADPLIVRCGERRPELVTHTGGAAREALKFYSLGRGKSDRHMEPFFIELNPDDGRHEHSSHQGEEFIVVVSGRVVLEHGNERHVLDTGDSLYFNSIVPHYIGAADGKPASIYAVLYFPE
ncbi:transcriptional regulator, XRE family [Alkalidesulfovibrio alkalitolerans DSM 16529]|uniref:Transcriptional regulator, XRE family n=1 Tax=Alkalidesulfovibrio alkalitolerans DSM 16529 TaxID=1121439 RepID=S7UGC9_9BACT|nr:cupin domain-containing protein [Alkalidesulfovibrio alkalitolerans]EPR32869.1 transcriptional regulator, XRE family [Alkalidesulfovibrio alkalitolerans DSM 16529]